MKAGLKTNCMAPSAARKIVFAAWGGFFIAFCYTAGYFLDRFDSLDLTEASFYGRWLAAALVIAPVLHGLWQLADWLQGRVCKETPGGRLGALFQKRIANGGTVYFLSVLFLFLCWLPALLSLFPGAFAYDANQEWMQVRDGMITAHHPVIHVLILGGLVEGFYTLTGSYEIGMAVYSLLQMLALANVFALTIVFLRKFDFSLHLRIFALIFYGLSPVVQLFSVCATKDVPFSGAQLLFMLYILFFYVRREEMLGSKKHMLCFALTAFFSMIFRNNGLYVTVIVLAVMAFSLRRELQKYGRRFLGALTGIFVMYLLYTGPFYTALHVAPGGMEEMLSVPLQQMARVHQYQSGTLEAEDLELLYTVVPREYLEQYRATVSDFVKKGFQKEAFEENKKGFMKLWLKWGLEHPLTYINSFLINTVDFWYPHAVVDGYRHGDGRSSYFDYQVDRPGQERVLLPGAHAYYESISHDGESQRLPFAFLALSPGWYFVMFLTMALFLWRNRNYGLLAPFMVPGLTFLTVLLGPMALVRYVLIFYFGFPVMLALFLQGNKCRVS